MSHPSPEHPIKTAVIGVGYLGTFHAEKYHQSPDSELIAVVDANEAQAKKIGEQLEVSYSNELDFLFGNVDAVSIVVPTQQHYGTAKTFLENGIHVLLEKPMTTTVEEAQELIDIARSKNVVLQIGHLERFNPAVLAMDGILNNPLFIESHRVAPFNPRGADVNVILDLMIHDIDIILDLVKSPVDSMDVSGVPVVTSEIDIANARIRFQNGCVANVTASRAGLKSERKMRIFQHDAYVSVDFQNKRLGVHQKGENEIHPGIPEIVSREEQFEAGDALRAEIDAFLFAIKSNSPPVVSGQDGLNALQTAIQITDILGATKNA